MSKLIEAELWPHPAFPPFRVENVRVRLERTARDRLHLRYEIHAPSDAVSLPPPAAPLRTDRLWETTCFELFLQPELGAGYREFNFSPSGAWAAYEFTGWRENMTQTPVGSPPLIDLDIGADRIAAEVRLSIDLPAEPYRVALVAIVAEGCGDRSFWAEDHPGSAPDFHHRACFTRKLPPAPGA